MVAYIETVKYGGGNMKKKLWKVNQVAHNRLGRRYAPHRGVESYRARAEKRINTRL